MDLYWYLKYTNSSLIASNLEWMPWEQKKYMYSFSEALSNRLSLFSDIINSTLEFGVWNSGRDFGSLSRDKKVLKKCRDYEVEFIKQVIRKIPQVDVLPRYVPLWPIWIILHSLLSQIQKINSIKSPLLRTSASNPTEKTLETL